MKKLLVFTVAALLWMCVAGCGGGPTTDDRLVILSPHWEGIQDEFEVGFADHWKVTTGRTVDVEWLDQGGTSSILRFIRSQFDNRPEGIDIDIFFGGGIDPHLKLKKQGLTIPFVLPDSILSRIPTTFAGIPMYDTTGHWYGATLSGFGVVYNSAVAKLKGLPIPKDWAGMSDPAMEGWIFAGDPRQSGSVHMAYEIMLQAYGWEKGWQVITAMAANSRGFARSAGDIPRAVSRGDAVAGMCIDFYAWAEVNRSEPGRMGFVYPPNLTVVNPDAMCILKGAPNMKVAQAFVRFIMSEQGQRIWCLKMGQPGGPRENQLNRFTVMPDLYAKYGKTLAVTINPFSWEGSFVYDSRKGSVRWGIVNDMIGAMLIDSQNELNAAWKSMKARKSVDEGITALAKAPITEAEALELGALWSQQSLRNKHIGRWTDFARQKYAEVNRGQYKPLSRVGI
jgi:ABC-type Fe3+ transport system substrate-binding protein